MNNSTYTVRNYKPADFNKYTSLHINAEKLEPTGWRCLSRQALAEHLERPNYSPEQDLFIAETSGNIVGYMDLTPELTIGRVVLDCWVHPEHRGRGLGKELLIRAIRRAGELGVKIARVNIPHDNATAKGLLAKLGFECVRRFLELRLDLAKARRMDIEQAALGCRNLRHGEESKLTRIQNRSFAGSWGYNLNTVEEITYFLNSSNCSPEDVVLACDGDRVAGYCWTKMNYGGDADASERKGRIFMLGVDPDYRGRGIGRRVLLAGLAHLKSKGLRFAELTVDSENETACALYRSVGFEVRTDSLWYEKAII
ncbi:GNAT family N-acetyltransferase [Chloroflexota bacterium]